MTIETIQAYSGIGTLLGLVIVAVLNQLEARRSRLVQSKIHVLVNSNMSVQLRLNSYQARRIADMTKAPEDEAAAVEAKRLMAEHDEQQRKVDSAG